MTAANIEAVLDKTVTAFMSGRNNRYDRPQGSGGSKFKNGLSASGRTIYLDHYNLRQNARDALQDSTQAKMVVDRYADTVVDTGLKVKPTPKHEILGITPEQAEKWADDVSSRFDMWAGSKKSDRAEINTFYQNQRMYHFFQQRDNDMFTRLMYSERSDLINPLQIKFIDPNQIRGYSSTNSYAQYNYDDGITRDGSGKETGYKIWFYSPEGKYVEKTIPARGARSKRIMMIHGFNPEYAGQGRGYTRLAHVLQEFENLTDFKISHILKAIQQTIFSVFVKPGPDNPATNILDEVAGPLGEAAEAEGLQVDEAGNIVGFNKMPEATIDTPGSVGVFNLNKGEDFKPFEHTAPVDNYDSFVSSFFGHISASMGMPVEVALMKFEQNYSSSRAALLLFWRIAQIWRNEMKADFLDPIYESWMSEEIAGGRIQAPGWSDPLMRAAWLSAWWAGAPMPNIDPMKTMKSDMGYAEMGAQTIDDIAENFNGSSGKANLAKNSRQFADVPASPWNGVANPGPASPPAGQTGDANAWIRKIADAVADEIEMRSD